MGLPPVIYGEITASAPPRYNFSKASSILARAIPRIPGFKVFADSTV
jgi:hypothetical protein